MGLDGRDDQLEDLVDEHGGAIGKYLKKIRFPLLMLLIGIILGGFLAHYYLEPTLGGHTTDTGSALAKTNELLTKENNCLYTLLDNARTDVQKCSTAYVDANTP